MTTSEDWRDRFVAHLEDLRDHGDRGALAALRRGLGSPPGTMPAVYPHILPWCPPYRDAEDACYIVGPLFALHPQPGGQATVGEAFSKIKDPSDSLKQRFVALLECHRDDLPDHLRQAVGLLKGKDIPVDWQQLLRDILAWDREDRRVQQRWARDFWRRPMPDTGEETDMVDTH